MVYKIRSYKTMGRKFMKKFLSVIALAVLCCRVGHASYNNPTYEEEMYLLGRVAGQGLACKSQKYHQFELLARALIVSKAANNDLQNKGMIEFNTGKANAFIEAEDNNFADCADILPSFENQQIFKSVLYSDGRIKLADGTIITPRKPYNASKLYVKDREAFIIADAAYKKYLAQAQKNAQNAEKVPLIDSRYDAYAKQFGN